MTPTVDYVHALDSQLLSESAKRDLLLKLSNVRTGVQALALRNEGLQVTDLDHQGRVKLISDPNTGVEIGVAFKRRYQKTPVFAGVAPSVQMRDESEAWLFINLLDTPDESTLSLREKIQDLERTNRRLQDTANMQVTLAEQQDKIIDSMSAEIDLLKASAAGTDSLPGEVGTIVQQLRTVVGLLVSKPTSKTLWEVLTGLNGLKSDVRGAFLKMNRDEERLRKATARVNKKAAKSKRMTRAKYAAMMQEATDKAKKPRGQKPKTQKLKTLLKPLPKDPKKMAAMLSKIGPKVRSVSGPSVSLKKKAKRK